MVKLSSAVYDFKGDGGVALAMYNTDESIRGFLLQFGLEQSLAAFIYLLKNTILKKYDGPLQRYFC